MISKKPRSKRPQERQPKPQNDLSSVPHCQLSERPYGLLLTTTFPFHWTLKLSGLIYTVSTSCAWESRGPVQTQFVFQFSNEGDIRIGRTLKSVRCGTRYVYYL